MSRFFDLTGLRFGRLTVLNRADDKVRPNGKRVPAWNCACDCGNLRIAEGSYLRRGTAESCGCLVVEKRFKHGHAGGKNRKMSPEYRTWHRMKKRCLDADHPDFEYYGGRGITVCDRWLEPDGQGFINFLEDMGERPEGLTLERKNNELGYLPENCVWTTRYAQSRNRRVTRWVEFQGRRLCLRDWAIRYGVNPATPYKWFAKGLADEEAVARMQSMFFERIAKEIAVCTDFKALLALSFLLCVRINELADDEEGFDPWKSA